MWTDIMFLARFRIYEFRKSCFLSARFYDLPGAVPCDNEDHMFTVSYDRTASVDKFFKQFQSILVNGKYPLPSVFLLLCIFLFNLPAAPRADQTRRAESGSTRAGQLNAAFEVNDLDCTL